MQEQRFETGTVRLNTVSGPAAGPPLLLLHGVTSRWQAWLPVMPALALRWQLYALDHRGHGRSGRVANSYRIVDYADDAIAFLRQQIGQPAVVMGHSLGAIIAIAIAAEVPELVRAVVLEDPPLGAFSDQRLRDRSEYPRFLALRELARARHTPADLIAALTALQPEADAAAIQARALALQQLDPEVLTAIVDDQAKEGYHLAECLARITGPVLLLQGNLALGAALEDERAAQATAALRHCTFVRMANVGHGMHSSDPLGFSRIVNDFLESLPDPTA